MMDYSSYATSSGTVYAVTVGADGLIHGLAICHIGDIAAHLAAVPGATPVAPAEAVKFLHGTAFALVDGAVVPAAYPLATIQARAIAALRAACAATITGGYTSAALAVPHTYPSTPIDQANMIASVTASLLPGLPADWSTPFWCADPAGVWAFHPHTAAQTRLAGLLAQVTGATTEDQVVAATW